MSSHIGFKNENPNPLSVTEHAVAGAFSGFITRGLLQPLDVIKIRFQVNLIRVKFLDLKFNYSKIFLVIFADI